MLPVNYSLDAATIVDTVEWIGAIFALAGATMLAMNTRASRWGWVAFLASNILLITLSVVIDRRGLLVMQIGLLGTSLLGIWRAFEMPGLWRHRDAPSEWVPAAEALPELDYDGPRLSETAAAALRRRYAPIGERSTKWF